MTTMVYILLIHASYELKVAAVATVAKSRPILATWEPFRIWVRG